LFAYHQHVENELLPGRINFISFFNTKTGRKLLFLVGLHIIKNYAIGLSGQTPEINL